MVMAFLQHQMQLTGRTSFMQRKCQNDVERNATDWQRLCCHNYVERKQKNLCAAQPETYSQTRVLHRHK